MNNLVEFSDHKAMEAEAAAWIARLDRGELSEEDRSAIRDWIDRSPEHYALISRLAGIWSDLDGLVEILAEVEPHTTTRGAHHGPRPITWFTPAKVVVFSTVIIAVVIGVLFTNNENYRSVTVEGLSWQASYLTEIGEQQTVALRDGSRVQLNTDTIIDVDFDDRQRKIRLVKGEALFEVIHNQSRPFLVYVGTNVIRAVGTAFVVKLIENGVEVTIKEGRVELKSLKDDTQDRSKKELIIASAMIDAGQTVKLNKEIQTLQEIATEEIDRKLAWRDGLIIFSGEPLDYVVEEINRYTNIKFIITDPELSMLRIGGRFKIGETDAMLEVLETGFGININRVSNDLVYLSADFRE